MTSMCGKHFQYLHLLEVNHYIETPNVAINPMNFSRVYLLHPIIRLSIKGIFSLFQLDIIYPVYYL